jgi:SAM-dependent methyltransferase
MSDTNDQYEKWVYPLSVDDLEADFNAGQFDRSDPSLFRRKLWPRPVEPESLKILIAGCGTVQAARYAYRNPECEVVGIDTSRASLEHTQRLKQKHRLANLSLHHLSILDVEQLGQQFDLIVSSGVLHHLPDPDAGLRKLKQALLPHGVMSIMVYGWYRRFGVYMMQDAFRLLGVEQTDAGVALVRETLAALPAWHHVHSYVKRAPDLNFDGGLVDTFLHRSDRAYTVPQVLRFASDNGLNFQDWLDRANYSISALIPEGLSLRSLASRLPPEQQWHLVELLSQNLGTHAFLLCHPQRDPREYVIDFGPTDGPGPWLSYIPHLRPVLEVLSPSDPEHRTPARLRRGPHEFTIDGPEAPLIELVNGNRTIGRIIETAARSPADIAATRQLAHRFFSRMHDWDHLMYEI